MQGGWIDGTDRQTDRKDRKYDDNDVQNKSQSLDLNDEKLLLIAELLVYDQIVSD